MTTASTRGLRVAEAIFALAVIALGMFVAYETTQIHAVRRTSVIGPTVFPNLVATGLVIVGLFALREAFVGRVAHVGEGRFELDIKAILLVSVGLLINLLTIESLGWLIATPLLFVCVARAFGSRRPAVDLAIGLTIAVLTFVVFNFGLDLNLPVGEFWEDLMDSMAPDEPPT